MYGCESWTIKKAECWRIDDFELWCWRRLLRVPWTARRSNQSILRRSVLGVHWKDWCWSWNSDTLATWCKELTHLKRPWCWEGLGAGGEGDDRGWDGWMASPTPWTWVWVDSGSWWWTGRPGMLRFMGSQRVGMTEWLNWNWISMTYNEQINQQKWSTKSIEKNVNGYRVCKEMSNFRSREVQMGTVIRPTLQPSDCPKWESWIKPNVGEQKFCVSLLSTLCCGRVEIWERAQRGWTSPTQHQ